MFCHSCFVHNWQVKYPQNLWYFSPNSSNLCQRLLNKLWMVLLSGYQLSEGTSPSGGWNNRVSQHRANSRENHCRQFTTCLPLLPPISYLLSGQQEVKLGRREVSSAGGSHLVISLQMSPRQDFLITILNILQEVSLVMTAVLSCCYQTEVRPGNF